MSKQPIKKQPTADDIDLALSRLKNVAHCLILLPDDDDPLAVVEALRTEVLDLREMREKLAQFVQEWSVKLNRR